MVDRHRLPDHVGDQRLPGRLGRHVRARWSSRSALTVLAFAAPAAFVRVDEPRPAATDGSRAEPKRVDLAGTIRVDRRVPGLFALILFATFNNFLGGVFMALLDAYGLSLVSVQAWGLLLGVRLAAPSSSAASSSRKTGLGKNPLRTLLLVNLDHLVGRRACSRSSRRSRCWPSGCFIWMFLGPYAEAAEHTTLQKVVPLRAAGPGVRLRPVGRAGRLAADRLPDRAARRSSSSSRS